MARKIDTDIIKKEFISAHSDRYDYSLVEYINAHTKVKIICPVHGIFEQQPRTHKLGQGCEECGFKSITNTLSKTIDKFIEIHKYKYDYSLVEYKNNDTKVKIICKEHGVFEQTPHHHKKGHGCKVCSQAKQYKDVPTYLYYIKIDNQYKIGVCLKLNHTDINKALKQRYNVEFKRNVPIEVINSELFQDGNEAYSQEQLIINTNKSKLIDKVDMRLCSGHTETFTEDISKIIT